MPEQNTRTSEDARPREGDATANAFFHAVKLLLGWNSDILRFYGQRAVRYGELPLRLMACSNVSDLQKLQDDFLRQLTEEYQDEAARLSRIAGNVHQASSPARGEDYAAALNKAQADATRIIEEAKAQAERIVAAAEARADGTDAQPRVAKKRASGA